MHVFYNNTTFDDVLMIRFKSFEAAHIDRIEVLKDTVLLYQEQNFIGVNILNATHYINGLKLGLNDLTEALVEQVKHHLAKEEIILPNIDVNNTFVVGEIKALRRVDGSDKLNMCQLDINQPDLLQVVCGASNVAINQKVVVATVGTCMPNGFMIGASKLKGIESNGMICSSKELGQTAVSTGILVLDDTAVVGEKYIR